MIILSQRYRQLLLPVMESFGGYVHCPFFCEFPITYSIILASADRWNCDGSNEE